MDTDYARRVEHVEAGDASLFGRFEELAQRIGVSHVLDELRAQIAGHPFTAVGAAAALGALVALRRPSAKSGVGSTLSAAIATTIVQIAKDYALRRVVRGAFAWWGGSREVDASYDPSIETVLEH